MSTSRDCWPDVDPMPDCSRLPLSLLCASERSLLCLWFLTSQFFPALSVCSATQNCWVTAWPSYVQLNPEPRKKVFLIRAHDVESQLPERPQGQLTEVKGTRCLPQRRAGVIAMFGVLQSLQSQSASRSWVTSQRVGTTTWSAECSYMCTLGHSNLTNHRD